MIAIPAIDIREGACVQLVGGSYDEERIRLDDPAGVASRWAAFGFRRLHVVDLDAATERGSNAAVVDKIIREASVEVQVGGGVRSTEQVDALVRAGARFVVAGTRAVESPEWLAEVATRYPHTMVVAADVHGRAVATRGWSRTLTIDVMELLDEIRHLPIAAALVTAVHVEGQMRGPDLSLFDDIVQKTSVPIIASGGIASIDDLRALSQRGLAGAVVGMALYTGAIEPRLVADEFVQ